MDQKRLFVAILISLAILLAYQFFAVRYLPHPPAPSRTATQQATPATATGPGTETATAAPGTAGPAVSAAPKPAPRIALSIAAPAVRGSINLRGARIDDLVLTKYRETEAANSPDVQLLAPHTNKHSVLCPVPAGPPRPGNIRCCPAPTRSGPPRPRR